MKMIAKEIQEEIFKILGKKGLSAISKMPKYTQENLLERLKWKLNEKEQKQHQGEEDAPTVKYN